MSIKYPHTSDKLVIPDEFIRKLYYCPEHYELQHEEVFYDLISYEEASAAGQDTLELLRSVGDAEKYLGNVSFFDETLRVGYVLRVANTDEGFDLATQIYGAKVWDIDLLLAKLHILSFRSMGFPLRAYFFLGKEDDDVIDHIEDFDLAAYKEDVGPLIRKVHQIILGKDIKWSRPASRCASCKYKEVCPSFLSEDLRDEFFADFLN